MMDRVLMVSYGVLSAENGYRSRIISELRQLRARAVDVDLLHFERVTPEQKSVLRREMAELGVDIIIVPRFRQVHGLLFPLDLVTAMFYGAARLSKRYSVVHSQGFAAAPVAWIISTVRKAAFVLDVHGIYSEEMRLRGQSLARLVACMESWFLRRARTVIAVSHRMLDHYASLLQGKGFVLPSCVDVSRFRWDPTKRAEVRRRLNLGDRPVLVYSGTLLAWQEADRMLQLYKSLRVVISDLSLLVVTPNLEEFSEAKKRHDVGADCVVVSAKHDEVSDYLNAGDVGLLLRSPNLVNQTASPTKFAEYLASGLPVLLSPDIGDTEEFVRRHCVGFVLSAERTTEETVAFIRNVIDSRGQYAEVCRAAAAKELSWDTQIRQLELAYSVTSRSTDEMTGVTE